MLPVCYSAGWERKRFDVCGRPLAPLTLGHARVLYLAGSPYVAPSSGDTNAQALLMAVCICVRAIAPTFAELPTLRNDATLLTVDDFNKQSAAFEDYVKYYTESPPRFTDGDAKPRMPWPWALYAALRRFYSMRETQAWETICADAFVLAAAVGIQNGDNTYATLAEADCLIAMET